MIRRTLHLKYGIEPDQRDEQAPIRLDEARAEEIAAIPETVVERIEGVEQPLHRPLIGVLGGREAGTIDAVDDVLVYIVVELIDLVPEAGGVEVERAVGESI